MRLRWYVEIDEHGNRSAPVLQSCFTDMLDFWEDVPYVEKMSERANYSRHEAERKKAEAILAKELAETSDFFSRKNGRK